MSNVDIVRYVLDALKRAGATQCQCNASFGTTHELSASIDGIELLRTVRDQATINMKAYVGDRSGSISLSTAADIDKGAQQCVAVAQASLDDPTPSMNEERIEKELTCGENAPDIKKLIERVQELIDTVKSEYQRALLQHLVVLYSYEEKYYFNSRGVELSSSAGTYKLTARFASFDGNSAGSFNVFTGCFDSLDAPLIEFGLLRTLLKQAEEQTKTVKPERKIVGTMVVAPPCLDVLLKQMLNAFTGSSSLLTGASRWQNALGTMVADARLSLASAPLDGRMVEKTLFTQDGFMAENQPVIEEGVLCGYMSDYYTANKTGLPRGASAGGNLVVEPGDKTLDEIISSIERGILVNRYSGGIAGAAGDISGIAKNSFLIENGRIAGAVRETMISGNLAEMLLNIRDISCEVVCDGSSVLPYIAFEGITIL